MAKFLCLGLVIFLTLAITSSQHSRLDRDVLPISYSLKLKPDMDGGTFDGEVTILIKNEKAISNITLNSKMLVINEITLDQAYGTTKYILDPTNEILQVFYEDEDYIDPGEHILNIKFTGEFISASGFYKLWPRQSNLSILLATKFSPNRARRAFPCFDEPYFKSTFSIRLIKPDIAWEALSNMREIGSYRTPDGIAVDFESTVPMSTYLLAWVITDYKHEKINYISGSRTIPLRFYNVEKKSPELLNYLKITEKALRFYENYTDIPFPLSKLDSIAIPYYMSRGMEHYGLVVYQAHGLFSKNPFSAKLYQELEADLLICHEIGHMWFGNLVTHGWYNDIWLTEGFARFMQYKAGAAILGEPFVRNIFQENKYLSLFKTRCRDDFMTETASFPRKLDQLGYKYGSAVYDQGGALLQMLEDLLGEEKFREVVREHLKGHQYGHSTTGEFINLMNSAEPKYNIRGIMESFLFQGKLPLVEVSIESGLFTDTEFFVLKQSPLCNEGHTSIFGDKWTIPIRYITSSNMTSRIVLFDREQKEVRIRKSKDDNWIKINNRDNGLYRAVYSREIYKYITNDFEKLPESDIGPIIEEAFYMHSIGKLQCDSPLKLIGALKKSIEKVDFLTFSYASRSFSLFSQKLDHVATVTKALRAYYLDIFEELYKKLTWRVNQKDTMNTRLLRMVVLESFCLRDPVYGTCYADVDSLKLSNETIHQDLEYIYKAVLNDTRHLNSTIVREITKQSDPMVENNPEQQACINWIQQNIPKFIGQN